MKIAVCSVVVTKGKVNRRRSIWAKTVVGGLVRPSAPWLRYCWASSSSSVGIFENHVRRDALRHAGRRYPRRGNSKWEANVVANISSSEISHHKCFLIPL